MKREFGDFQDGDEGFGQLNERWDSDPRDGDPERGDSDFEGIERGDFGPEDGDFDFEGFEEGFGSGEEEPEPLNPFERRALRISRRQLLDASERNLWLDLWRAPVLDAIEEQGIETRFYGPIQVTVAAAFPEEPFLNLLLGADEPGALSGGRLAEALAWIDSLELECRAPLDPERPESPGAEELLGQWGYRRTESQVRFLREGPEPELPAPPGIGVREMKEFTEGYGDLLGEGYELGSSLGWFFDGLPGRERWRCYLGYDAQGDHPAAAAMLVGYEVAQLGFMATAEDVRGLGYHFALMRRCIADAGDHHPRTLLAETTEPLGARDPSPGARNLLRAGFRQASVRGVWRRG